MKIAIVGSGLMGGKLGTLWAHVGHDVTFSYARSTTKLARLASEAGARQGSVEDAVAEVDAVLLAVDWSGVGDVLEQAGDLAGKLVVNCCVPLDMQNRDLVVGVTTSGAEELARMRPKARWVSAFHTSPSEAFFDVFARKGRESRPQLLYCGDDHEAKATAAGLIEDIGYEPLDAGPLRTSRFIEPFAMVTAELAYVQPGGPKLTYRFSRL
ncbi:NAD(P)-binding domain-containing protein (plasmid) [Ensifer sp. D2-11]